MASLAVLYLIGFDVVYFLTFCILCVYNMASGFVHLGDSCVYEYLCFYMYISFFFFDSFLLCLFVLSYCGLFLFNYILFCYYSLDACLFSNERQKGFESNGRDSGKHPWREDRL